MGITLNAPGAKYAKSLINRGKVDRESTWSFSAEDGDKILGPEGNDWNHFVKVHLGKDDSVDAETKAHGHFPIIKDGKLCRAGVADAKRRAAEQGAAEVEKAADELLQMIDSKKDGWTTVSRCDISDFLWDNLTSPLTKTHEGFLQGRAAVTNIGVFPYPQPDGTVRYELRCPDEVFKPESFMTLEGKPLTNDHPEEGVKPGTAQSLTVGSISCPGTDPYRVYANVSIIVQKAIEAVQGGKRALSCGYTCDLDPTPGVWMGVAYTHIQRNIRYNHVALVDKGRAGDDAVLRSDGSTSINIITKPTKGNTMRKIRLDNGVEAEADELVIAALDSAKSDAKKSKEEADKAKDAAKSKDEEMDKATKELDKAKGELDAAKEKVKALEEKLKEKGDSAPAEFAAAVAGRVKLLDTAKTFGADFKADASDADIKAAVVTLVSKDFKADGKSAEYLEARYDAAVDELTKARGAAGSRQMGDLPPRNDSAAPVDDAALTKARNDAHSHLYGAWDKSRANG